MRTTSRQVRLKFPRKNPLVTANWPEWFRHRRRSQAKIAASTIDDMKQMSSTTADNMQNLAMETAVALQYAGWRVFYLVTESQHPHNELDTAETAHEAETDETASQPEFPKPSKLRQLLSKLKHKLVKN